LSASSPERPIPAVAVPARAFVRWLRYLKLRLLLGSKLKIGKNVYFGRRVQLRCPEHFTVQDNVIIGSEFITETNAEIGNDVLISTRVAFVGNDHAFSDPERTIFTDGRLPPCTVILEGDNLLGFGTIVVGNVRIGRGCIVGAGSVVVGEVPAGSLASGVPATFRPLPLPW